MALLGALGHLANLGQFVEIGQGHAHQKEQIHWTHKNYRLDVQALKIDLLGAARDDVRGTYDTYIERLDTLLLVNALLLPFALNTLQFSDEFMPNTEETCPEWCVEVYYPLLVVFWVYLVGLSIIMPFWSLLLLLWCKIKMDHWLQFTLAQLQKLRREIITGPAGLEASSDRVPDESAYAEHEEIVTVLGTFIVEYQDFFTDLWTEQCSPLVHRATHLLWLSACASVALVGYMFWMFLVNRRGDMRVDMHFAGLMMLGLLAPLVCFTYMQCKYGQDALAERTLLRQSGGRGASPLAHACSIASAPAGTGAHTFNTASSGGSCRGVGSSPSRLASLAANLPLLSRQSLRRTEGSGRALELLSSR